MLIGCAQVPIDDQNQSLELQRDTLQNIGYEQIYQDQISGTEAEHPSLKQAIEYARAGDTLVVRRQERQSRSLKDLIVMFSQLVMAIPSWYKELSFSLPFQSKLEDNNRPSSFGINRK